VSSPEITLADNLRFIGKMTVRSLCFALLGAVLMALWSGLHGLWTGAIFAYMLWPDETWSGSIAFAERFAGIGSISGAVSFWVVGWLSHPAHSPVSILRVSAIKALRWSFYGIVTGGFAFAINMYGYYALILNEHSLESSGMGLIFGVIFGFAIGTGWGALKGVRLEVERQQSEMNAKS
jgi:hypothetical protein